MSASPIVVPSKANLMAAHTKIDGNAHFSTGPLNQTMARLQNASQLKSAAESRRMNSVANKDKTAQQSLSSQKGTNQALSWKVKDTQAILGAWQSPRSLPA